MLKVGFDRIFDNKKGGNRLISYNDIEYDFDGWADATKFFPIDFDLMHLKTDTKTVSGWACGNKYDGLHINSNSKILYWKRQN